MKRSLLLLAVLLSILGCGAPTTDVAITQTGNPSQVSLAFTVGSNAQAITPTETIRRKITTREDVEINTITITSAELVVNKVVLTGDTSTLTFHKEPPYIVNVALDSSRVVLDSIAVEVGTMFDSVELTISSAATSTILNNQSIGIKGFTTDNSADAFTFTTEMPLNKKIALSNPLVVSDKLPNRIVMLLDISKWFIDDEDGYINPHDEDATEEIEELITESIEKSIDGEEDHEDDEDDEDEDEIDSNDEETQPEDEHDEESEGESDES